MEENNLVAGVCVLAQKPGHKSPQQCKFLFFPFGISFSDSKTLTLWPAWHFCDHESIYEINNIYFSTS